MLLKEAIDAVLAFVPPPLTGRTPKAGAPVPPETSAWPDVPAAVLVIAVVLDA